MNNDGFADVMAYGIKQFQLWLGDGQGNWMEDAYLDIGDDPGYGNAIRAGGDLDQNGFPDLIILAQELTGGFIQFNKNILYVFAESSPADSLWIEPAFPAGGENFYPGTVHFIEWNAEVPAGETSSVTIEISAYGPEGPWWMLAENIPNNGKHQWAVPDYGSEDVHLKLTVHSGSNTVTTETEAFNIFGTPTKVRDEIRFSEFQLFPNPGGDYVTIVDHQLLQKLTLTDIAGKVSFKQTNPEQIIDLSALPSGIYFYQAFYQNGHIINGKWIKK
jgi:hypothetical protein